MCFSLSFKSMISVIFSIWVFQKLWISWNFTHRMVHKNIVKVHTVTCFVTWAVWPEKNWNIVTLSLYINVYTESNTDKHDPAQVSGAEKYLRMQNDPWCYLATTAEDHMRFVSCQSRTRIWEKTQTGQEK